MTLLVTLDRAIAYLKGVIKIESASSSVWTVDRKLKDDGYSGHLEPP